MFNQSDNGNGYEEERFFSWYRIKTFLIGSVAVVVLGLLLVSFYTYFQYGGTPFDSLFGKGEKQSEAAGKLAFDKRNDKFIGVIRGEGHSVRLGAVYYVEKAAGQLIEVEKDSVIVREPQKK